jgi:hypothetical protein
MLKNGLTRYDSADKDNTRYLSQDARQLNGRENICYQIPIRKMKHPYVQFFNIKTQKTGPDQPVAALPVRIK